MPTNGSVEDNMYGWKFEKPFRNRADKDDNNYR